MSISIELVEALKRCLRGQGVTYRELAGRIGMSEAAIKRMFSLKAMQLRRIEQICDELGIGLSELAAEAARTRPPLSELSEAQEQALVARPELLMALFLVINRWQQSDVQAHLRFSEPEWIRLLTRLDRLGIIELLPGNRARLLTARNFRWRRDGPMERYFRHHFLQEYFDDAFDGEQDALLLLTGALSMDGIKQLHARLQEVAREFDALLARDATLPANERIGMSLVLAQKPWMLPSFGAFWREDGILPTAER